MAKSEGALARRVEDLEVKVAFQENLLTELDDVLRVLRDELDRLRTEHADTRAQVDAMAPEPENTKPPHY